MSRTCLLIAVLGSATAFAQQMEPPDKCILRCNDAMTACVSRTTDNPNMKGTTRCNEQMNSCMARCQGPNPTIKVGKGTKCGGPNGTKMDCSGTFKKPPPPKAKPDAPEQFPNKAAKDLAKDPNFKGGEALQ